jgi:hypothetical protein
MAWAPSFAVADSASEAGGHFQLRCGQEVILIGVTTKPGLCQVRSKTERPCPHQAVMEIWGIPFCEACAREQEAYFDIGKLTMQAQGLAPDPELRRLIAEAGKH